MFMPFFILYDVCRLLSVFNLIDPVNSALNMPAIVVKLVQKLGGNPVIKGSMSYKPEATFHELRGTLEKNGMIPFPFYFIDSLTRSPMLVSWEGNAEVQDYGPTVTVIQSEEPVEESAVLPPVCEGWEANFGSS